MRENKRCRNVIKRVISSVMAFTMAMTLCLVAEPQRVLAEDTGGMEGVGVVSKTFYVYKGQIYTDKMPDGIVEPDINGSLPPGLEPSSVLAYADNTLTFKGSQDGFTVNVLKDGQTLLIAGKSAATVISLSGPSSVTIKMDKDASLKVSEFIDYASDPSRLSLKDAVSKGKLALVNGKISGDDKIVYAESADPEPEPTPAPADVSVGTETTEKGKTAAESPTYKVTKKDGNTGEITYEKPATSAENIKAVEEVPSEVVLGDGNKYKVTKVGDRAFADIPGKEKIKEIKLGENIEEIGAEACKGLPSLEKVTFNKKVKKIDKGAFALCKNLKTANLPADLEEVGESAFEKTNISSANFGKNVKKIDRKAYYKCKKLKKITVKSKKLTKKSRVAKNAFSGASKKLKVKIKVSKAKTKESIIKVFQQKKIGYKSTWTVG